MIIEKTTANPETLFNVEFTRFGLQSEKFCINGVHAVP